MQDIFSLDGLFPSDLISSWDIIPILFFAVIICVIIYSRLYKKKLKKLKSEWIWILKKTKVVAVKEVYHSWDDSSSWYCTYWLESKDEEWNLYKSDTYKDLEYKSRSVEEMKRKFNWVEYDLTNKDAATKQINDNISRIESELSNNPWFFKKRKLKLELDSMKEYLEMANEWPIDPYIVINGHKLTIWDEIDVYVDANNIKRYYYDLDFTKEKC